MDKEFYDELVKEDKKKKISIIVTIIVLLLLTIALIFIYYKVVSKNYLKETIINIFDYNEKKFLKEESAQGQYKIEFNGTTADSENKVLYNLLNNLDINFNIKLDTVNELLDIDFDTDYYKQDLINLSIYSEGSDIYYYMDGMYDKYIKYDIDILSEEMNINLAKEDDYKIVMKSIKNALEINLKDEYFTKEKVIFENKKVTKNMMILDENTSIEFEENFYNYLLQDNNFMQSYASIKNKENEEVRKEIQEYLVLLKEEPYNLTLSLYNNYSNFIKLEIVFDEEKIDITKKNNNKYEFIYEGEEKYIGSIDIDKNKDKEEIKFKIKDSLSRNIMNIKITADIKKDIKIEKKDMSNSINANDITEVEWEKMSNSLMENQGFIKLIQDLLETEYSSILNNTV